MPPHFFGPCPKKREWHPKEKRLFIWLGAPIVAGWAQPQGGVYLKHRLTSSMEIQDFISSSSLPGSGETPAAFGFNTGFARLAGTLDIRISLVGAGFHPPPGALSLHVVHGSAEGSSKACTKIIHGAPRLMRRVFVCPVPYAGPVIIALSCRPLSPRGLRLRS